MVNYSRIISNIRIEVEQYLMKSKLKSLIIGVSGGLDSAICCALVADVCHQNDVRLIGRSITIESNKTDEIERARMVGDAFCSDFMEKDLTEAYKCLRNAIESDEIMENNTDKLVQIKKIRRGNIKARVRMIYLYNLAYLHSGMVLSTDNLTELRLGFWTLHGDVGDYGMIQNLTKTEVYDLTIHVANSFGKGIQQTSLLNCVDAVPTDGLGITNSDLDQILPGWNKRFDTSRQGYGEVDRIFGDYFAASNDLTSGEVLREMETNPIIERYHRTHFKRSNPINLSREILFK